MHSKTKSEEAENQKLLNEKKDLDTKLIVQNATIANLNELIAILKSNADAAKAEIARLTSTNAALADQITLLEKKN